MQASARRATWIVLVGLGLVGGCKSWFGASGNQGGSSSQFLYPPNCQPSCVLGCGQSDGCGGTCGCGTGLACSTTGQCVPSGACVETCTSTGWTCGSVCGSTCGACGSDRVCIQGQCLAARDLSCADCPLQLQVLDTQRDADNRLSGVTLGVVYAPPEAAPRARIADIRVQADRAVTVTSATLGPQLADMGKELFLDPTSQKPWQELSEGVHQLLIISRTDTRRFEGGELLRLHYAVDARVGAASFRLLKRDELLAPADANNVVQASGYDAPVVVH